MAPLAGEYDGGEPVATGFWGPGTSTLDWCESNYATTGYIAEFLSNVVFIVPPLFGIMFAWRDKVDMRFILSYIGVISIGVGSTAFHMTLKLHSQMLDEMSMLWSTSFFVYCLMESKSKPKSTNVSLVVLLLCYNVVASLTYVILQKPLLFQFAFGSLTVVLIARAAQLASKHKECSGFLLWYGITMYIIAFTLWNIDNLCCEYVQWFKNSLPSPLSGLAQLHAWWHILVGIACHCQILLSCHLRYTLLKHRCAVEVWCGFLPFLRVHATESSSKLRAF